MSDEQPTTDPELLARLRAATREVMQGELPREQRISWIIGQTGASRELVERIVDRGY